MLVFKLGGKASLPPRPEFQEIAMDAPASTASAAQIKNGEALYQRYCGGCHGDVAVSGGVLPDLRHSSTLANEQWFDIVLGGILKPQGMTSFAKEISRPDATAIRDYVIFRANQSKTQADHDAGKAASPDKR